MVGPRAEDVVEVSVGDTIYRKKTNGEVIAKPQVFAGPKGAKGKGKKGKGKKAWSPQDVTEQYPVISADVVKDAVTGRYSVVQPTDEARKK